MVAITQGCGFDLDIRETKRIDFNKMQKGSTMSKAALYKAFENKYEELKAALSGDDLDKMKQLTLEVHAMVHPAEVSGASEKTIADYVLDYMLAGNQNVMVPRQIWDTDLHYAGTDLVPLCC